MDSVKKKNASIWSYFSCQKREYFKKDAMFQYCDYYNSFGGETSECIAKIVVDEILREGILRSYFCLASRIKRKLNEELKEDKKWHVVVGDSFASYVDYERYILLGVCSLRIVIFTTVNQPKFCENAETNTKINTLVDAETQTK